MRIEQATTPMMADLWSELESRVLAADFLEEGAQFLATHLYGRFEESVVITRVFVTVPFGDLPEANQKHVHGLLQSAEDLVDLKPTTPVLSLIGSYGQEENWRDRRRSTGHVGIPMVSSSFIRAIPMISRLLKEFGVPVDWVDSHDAGMIVDTIGSEAGLFFVEDAASATNSRGQNIIGERDFVSRYGVKTVFGVGGGYATGQFAVIVTFCRDAVTRNAAERFLALAAFFISHTAKQVAGGRIFRD